MNILALETSMGACSAAALRGEGQARKLFARQEAMDRGHAEALMPMVAEVMAEAGLGFSDLDLIAYHDQLPTDDALATARRAVAAGDDPPVLLLHREADSILEVYEVDGVEIQVAHLTIEAWERDMASVLEQFDAATTVRVRGGATEVTDGPFAETKEYLAGFFLIDAPDLDVALAWAARIPSAEYGSVEVRPVWAPDGS